MPDSHRPDRDAEPLAYAAADYRWLLDHGYPETGSLKLVGDRYRLNREERHVLFRGVAPTVASATRRTRIVAIDDVRTRVGGSILGLDGHNVILTVANYLQGVRVFVSDDGLVRDTGAVHGRVHDGELMRSAIRQVARRTAELAPAEVCACFDSPVSHSRDHANLFARELSEAWNETATGPEPVVTIELASSADGLLRRKPVDILATADSALIDATAVPVLDLGRFVIESAFGASLFSPFVVRSPEQRLRRIALKYVKQQQDGEWVPHPAGFRGVEMKYLRRQTEGWQASIAFVRLATDAVVAAHVHETQDDNLFILEGHATMRVADDVFEIGPGSQVSVPAGTEHEIYDVRAELVIYDVFAPPAF